MTIKSSQFGAPMALALVLVSGCSTQPVAPDAMAADRLQPAAAECVAAIAEDARNGERRLDADAIRVVNWNIQKGGDPAWTADLAALNEAADLLVLQEASPALGLPLNVATAHHVAFAEGFKGLGRQTGVMTVSRAPPLTECGLSAREPWLGTRKATLVTEYGLTGTDKTLLVLNIHGVNFSLGARELAAQIGNAEAIIEAHDGPVLFSGDFNTWRAGRTRLLEKVAARLGLDALEYDADYRKRVLGRPLDHIYTKGLVAVSATTYDLESSDHNPMTVEFRLGPEALLQISSP